MKASTFSNIMALTARYEDAADQAGAVAARQELAAAWSAMLQRPCPKECQFESDAEVGYLRMGSALCEDDGLIRGHQVVLPASDWQCRHVMRASGWLQDGQFRHNRIHRGAVYHFDFDPQPGDDWSPSMEAYDPGLHVYNIAGRCVVV